jgi:hypothetical protein
MLNLKNAIAANSFQRSDILATAATLSPPAKTKTWQGNIAGDKETIVEAIEPEAYAITEKVGNGDGRHALLRLHPSKFDIAFRNRKGPAQ